MTKFLLNYSVLMCFGIGLIGSSSVFGEDATVIDVSSESFGAAFLYRVMLMAQ